MSKEFQIRDGNLIASFDLENEDGDIDFCKLLKVSKGIAEEIGMFVDYVATNKIIDEQSKKIADLEAKLAENEITIGNLTKIIDELSKGKGKTVANALRIVTTPPYLEKLEEIKKLKQQLAEKEKEIKTIKIDLGMYKSVNQFLNEYGFEKAKKVLLSTEKQKIKDKTEFAIQQLERVKELLVSESKENPIVYDITNDLVGGAIDKNNTFKIIDQIIAETKGEGK